MENLRKPAPDIIKPYESSLDFEQAFKKLEEVYTSHELILKQTVEGLNLIQPPAYNAQSLLAFVNIAGSLLATLRQNSEVSDETLVAGILEGKMPYGLLEKYFTHLEHKKEVSLILSRIQYLRKRF